MPNFTYETPSIHHTFTQSHAWESSVTLMKSNFRKEYESWVYAVTLTRRSEHMDCLFIKDPMKQRCISMLVGCSIAISCQSCKMTKLKYLLINPCLYVTCLTWLFSLQQFTKTSLWFSVNLSEHRVISLITLCCLSRFIFIIFYSIIIIIS